MRRDLHEWNNRIVAEFRSNSGFVPWSTGEDLARGRPIPRPLPGFDPRHGAPIILVSHTGAASGRRRTNPLMFQPVNGAFAIFGGSPRPPAWYRNIERNPDVTIEVGADVTPATARIARDCERERIWSSQVRLMPAFADFEKAAGRQIPVVILDPNRRSCTRRGHDEAGHDAPQ